MEQKKTYVADLHIHSKYSRATSRECDPSHLDLWARYKGVDLVGTGDFTHAKWREELKETLVPEEEGFYTLKEECRLPATVGGEERRPRFVVTGEISSIYKKNGKTRKVHNVILLPSLEEGDKLAHRLEAIGNLHSDGRPILGLDCRDLLEITLESCPEAVFIPAHIWTPHFSLFGAFSGFDTIEECFEDLTPYIHALETGLSSDPPMNRRVSALDRFTLVSNSDAHSPMKLAREANLMQGVDSYHAMARALQGGEDFLGTLEFFPEEGKYHWDGHRNCGRRLSPKETMALGGICPTCGKKITIGVEHRVEALADRETPISLNKPFEQLVPLTEIIADTMEVSASSKKVQKQYFQMLETLGSELEILRKIPIATIEEAAGPIIARGVEKLREGDVKLTPGYDGEYGTISLFTRGELEELRGEQSLFLWEPLDPPALTGTPATSPAAPKGSNERQKAKPRPEAFNRRQIEAVTAAASTVAVIAGPGTGKTKTLVERIAYLLEQRGVSPKEITAVTFTNRAAAEMRERLAKRLGGKKYLQGMAIGTFHRICLDLLPKKPLIHGGERRDLLKEIGAELGIEASPRQLADALSRHKNGMELSEPMAWLPQLWERYQQRLEDMGCRDLDDLLLEGLAMDIRGLSQFRHLLVDEFQDINEIQHRLVQHWSESGELFVIGDPDQSIYGFRGADDQCFKRLVQNRPETKTISLEENYRSTPEILQCAVEVITKNGGKPRSLRAMAPSGEAVSVVKCPTPFREAVWLAKEINALCGGVDMLSADRHHKNVKKSRSLGDIAVLCRTRKQLKLIEECLTHEGIPAVITAREDYLDHDDVRGCLGFFRSLIHPKDIPSLAIALKLVFQCPDDEIKTLCGVAAKQTHWDITALQEALGHFGKAMAWIKMLETFLPQWEKRAPSELIEAWAEQWGTGDALEKLIHAALFHDTMEGFLAALDLGEEQDIRRATGRDYTTDAVQLMTLHGAKGLEFPVVFLAGVNRGTLPLERAGETPNTKEERRLLFVGITRAKESLTLTIGEGSSPFLAELPSSIRVETIKVPTPKEEEPTLF